MKGDMLAGLDTPREELTEDRPPKEYLTPAAVRLHAFAFLALTWIALTAVAILFALAGPMCEDNSRALLTAAATPATRSTPPTLAAAPATSSSISAGAPAVPRPTIAGQAPRATGTVRTLRTTESTTSGAATTQPSATAHAGATARVTMPANPSDALAMLAALPACMGEGRLFLLVVLCGTIGGLIHAITSFVDFAGNRQLMRSWVPWLYLRAPIASLLAVLVYLAYRAGVIGDGKVSSLPDLYKIALAAGLAGLFSKQVTDKMSDLVDNIFVPSQKPDRKDALIPDQPQAASQGATTAPAEDFDEGIQAVQRLLMELGYLPQLTDGRPSDDGLLDDVTRAAVEAFLRARGITGEQRRASLGEEVDPDFWPRLLEILETEAAKRH